jgi:hypothetical protein
LFSSPRASFRLRLVVNARASSIASPSFVTSSVGAIPSIAASSAAI